MDPTATNLTQPTKQEKEREGRQKIEKKKRKNVKKESNVEKRSNLGTKHEQTLQQANKNSSYTIIDFGQNIWSQYEVNPMKKRKKKNSLGKKL